MNDEQIRKDFEEWMGDGGLSPRAIGRNSMGDYILMQTAHAWEVWQAAHTHYAKSAAPAEDGDLMATYGQPQADARDTERLDWLIEQGCSNGVVYEFDKSFWMAWLDGYDAHKDEHQIGRYHTAREAIDAAIAAAKENK